MVTDPFGVLLQELGKKLNLPNLKPDNHNSCLLHFPNNIEIQIELDSQGNFLTLGCDLGRVPPGKYRENVFREALRANNLPYPRHGDFAFSTKKDSLVLFKNLTVKDLTGEKVFLELLPFLEKSKTWTEAILSGNLPTLSSTAVPSRGGGIFGLK